ncbi:heterokaryon incompatibility protein-domain-containing protein [Lasiosphaeris hirsuta]|uniref:Heterokaryon incompatibility protein-domain-containing protein n=1 Tax=Lasiosphaeris hirsuta TaxID=260670 RepID=A0AA40B212_9PEZI|nr:heterokaryon incompatibility protein-domain-containing protein [Lasiosphaeris hirsuta]
MSNVKDALQTLQLPDQERYLWIDSICIRQDDQTEKAWQIGLMKDIFGGAATVIGWLGRGRESRGALSQLVGLPAIAVVESERLLSLDPKSTNFSLRGSKWRAVTNLLRNKWFCRVWMVQEVACGKRLVLRHGEEQCDWDTLVEVVNKVYQQEPSIRSCLFIGTASVLPGGFDRSVIRGFSNIHEMETIRHSFKVTGGLSPGFLLRSCTRFEATFLKDKVYALSGLLAKSFPQAEIDYTESTTDRSVILNAAKNALVDGDISLIDLAGCVDRSLEADELKLPSWCPDLFASLQPTRGASNDGLSFRAATHLKSSICRLQNDEDLISVRGTITGKIAQLGQIWRIETIQRDQLLARPEKSFQQILALVRESLKLAKGSSMDLYPYEDYEELLWRTVTGDACELIAGHSLPKLRATFCKLHTTDSVVMDDELDPEDRENVGKILYAVGRMMGNSRLCRTLAGRLGVVPAGARVGEEIAALWGACNLSVLRRSEEGIQNLGMGYRFVGSCYVQ